MIISKQSLLFFVGVSLFIVGCNGDTKDESGTTGTTPPTTTASVTSTATFATVHEVMKTRCLQCHNGPTGKEGVDFSSYESVMKGGKDGPIVKPGDPDNSLIIKAIHGSDGIKHMPPMGDPLTEDQMKAIHEWIAAGAPNS
jgi:mono/diheme cytochrome c family protein